MTLNKKLRKKLDVAGYPVYLSVYSCEFPEILQCARRKIKTFKVKLISWFVSGIYLDDRVIIWIAWRMKTEQIVTSTIRVVQPGWNPVQSAIYAAVFWSTVQPSVNRSRKFVLVWDGEPLWVHSEYLMPVNTAGGISVSWQTCRPPRAGIWFPFTVIEIGTQCEARELFSRCRVPIFLAKYEDDAAVWDIAPFNLVWKARRKETTWKTKA
jgi:hypothetical protein